MSFLKKLERGVKDFVSLGGYSAAKNAAKAQEKAARSANKLQQTMYDTSRADLADFREGGVEALTRLRDVYKGDKPNYDEFYKSPDYNFRQREGMQSLYNDSIGSGLLDSGATLRAAIRYNQDLAGEEFGNWWNRNAHMAGDGQNAAAQQGANAINTGRIMGNNARAAGDARASGYLGAQNSLLNGAKAIASVAGSYMGGGSVGSSGPRNTLEGRPGGVPQNIPGYGVYS